MAERTGLADVVYFLHAEYSVYYWELIELGRRSFLTVREAQQAFSCHTAVSAGKEKLNKARNVTTQ